MMHQAEESTDESDSSIDSGDRRRFDYRTFFESLPEVDIYEVLMSGYRLTKVATAIVTEKTGCAMPNKSGKRWA